MVIYNKMLIVHIQYLLRVGGSILAGVFLTSLFVLPESSYSSDAASSRLLLAWYSTALVQIVSPSQQWLQKLVVIKLHRFLCCGVKPI